MGKSGLRSLEMITGIDKRQSNTRVYMQFGMRRFKASKSVDDYREFREVYAELTSSLMDHGFSFDVRPEINTNDQYSSARICADSFRFKLDYYPVEAHFDSWQEQIGADHQGTLEVDFRAAKELSSAREYMESNFDPDRIYEDDESVREYVERRLEELGRVLDGLGTN